MSEQTRYYRENLLSEYRKGTDITVLLQGLTNDYGQGILSKQDYTDLVADFGFIPTKPIP